MKSKLDILKGIHPGKIIGRDLKKKGISQRSFAESIGEHSQTINAIIAGRRNITTPQALKIEKELNYAEGFLAILQVYYDISKLKEKSETFSCTPDIRKNLFWDTDFGKIDWNKNKRFVIDRIIERGTAEEKEEIARFYNIDKSELNKFRYKNTYTIHSLEKK